MPKLTRWFVRASLVYLGLSLLLAVLLAARPIFSLPAYISGLTPVFYHLFMVGWLTQLIFGVMHWMFPKVSSERPRGSETAVWFAFIALNLGLLLRTIAEPLIATQQQFFWNRLLAISASLKWTAALAFVFNTWRRVKER